MAPSGGGDEASRAMSGVLDRFIPRPDARRRHEITIHAPASVVLEVAREFDMQSIGLVRAIIRLRGVMLGARTPARRQPAGLLSEMLGMGWGRLAEEPDRFFVAGAACQPWVADVVFTTIAPESFAAFSTSDQVKIVWTLESRALGPARSRFATETRVVATDEIARAKFRRYWRLFGIGMVAIRWLLLPALRRTSERRWRSAPSGLEDPAFGTPTASMPQPRP
jgi:hypothetical protein